MEVVRWKDDEFGNNRPLASWYLCETCGGLALTLEGLKYCYSIDEPISQQIRKYVQEYGPL